jgi:CRP-like cAMP-binding protein
LGDEKIYPVSATAMEPVTVCFMELDFFDVTLKVNHAFTYQLMQFYANELQDAERRMRNLVHMEVKGRIAETLLLLKKTFGKNSEGYIDILLSRQDIAAYAGTTYETLFRVMKSLVKEKVIKIKGKKIFIFNEVALNKLQDSTDKKTLT